ncbi:MAG: hypothetical protein V1738_02205 [Patescibacteria group bacterium]
MDKKLAGINSASAYIKLLVPILHQKLLLAELPDDVRQIAELVLTAVDEATAEDLASLHERRPELAKDVAVGLLRFINISRSLEFDESSHVRAVARIAALNEAIRALHRFTLETDVQFARHDLSKCWCWLVGASGDMPAAFAVMSTSAYSESVRHLAEDVCRNRGLNGIWEISFSDSWKLFRRRWPPLKAMPRSTETLPPEFAARLVWRGDEQFGQWTLIDEPESSL